MPIIQTMKSAQQIYNYLSERLDTSDENIRGLLKKSITELRLKKITSLEKMHKVQKWWSETLLNMGIEYSPLIATSQLSFVLLAGKSRNRSGLHASPAARSSASDHSRRAVRSPRTAFPCPAPRFYHPRREFCLTPPPKLAIIIFAGDGEE